MGLGKAATAYVDGGVPGNKDFNTFQELEVWKVKQLCFALLFFPRYFQFFFRNSAVWKLHRFSASVNKGGPLFKGSSSMPLHSRRSTRRAAEKNDMAGLDSPRTILYIYTLIYTYYKYILYTYKLSIWQLYIYIQLYAHVCTHARV